MKYTKLILIGLVSCLFVSIAFAGNALHQEDRSKFRKLYNQGNYKEAYEGFKKLALDSKDSPKQVGEDLNMAVGCLRRINRVSEIDEFREKVIEIHKDNWRLLYIAARSYFDDSNYYGYIVADEFHRGDHRGGGRYVSSHERDRIRGLQLMSQAIKKTEQETQRSELTNFYLEFARMLMGHRGYDEAWRLQYLSDFSELPDYKDGYYHGGNTQGAPVTAEGIPVFHKIPASYEQAKTDGERWRWMLVQAMELDSSKTNQVLTTYADFLYQQFGVQTMSSYGRYFRGQSDEGEKDESGTYALHTLEEDETIARLATGIKRFTLPDEFNFIKIYQRIANSRKGYSEQALNTLAQIFENRRQYEEAIAYWKRSLHEHGSGQNKWKQEKINQIIGGWGQFEPVMTHPEGKGATVEYRFRNGTKVNFQAHEIRVEQLLNDVKAYLKANPSQLDWDKMNIGNIGYRIVQKNEKKYIGKKAADWALTLKPRKRHFDKRITIKTPLKAAGAYLLTAKMADGNTSKIIIWINDTVIVKKQLNKNTYFFVADAVTGKPLPKVNVEFFGYQQKSVTWEKYIGRHYNILTTNFAEFTDDSGQVIPNPKDFDRDYCQWIITATTKDGRFAYLGFTGIWYGGYYDHEYNQTKTFTITDRPVYRPDQPVKFKFWVRHAKYDQEDASSFANQTFTVRFNNPKGEKVFEKSFIADSFGGFDGEYFLPKDATLGVYTFYLLNYGAGGSFRVEEYKKPEFEVKVNAPTEPVALGEKITSTIEAKYYFGAPVTKAKVKYKILRSDYRANWYPMGIWDWFYGRGYWWFGYDYNWYPGWHDWGCERPLGWWWPVSRTPPEVVAEAEVEIGEDGIVKVEIDTAVAKALHGDTDHRYEITAEVIDQSRRTIVGKGIVLVSRKPFKVYAWVDRGHYRIGDIIGASFSAQTLDNKPVEGKGKLTLYRISYDDNKPVETVVQKWALNTDDEGRASIQIKASWAGQYRLSYNVTDSKKHTIEGGYVFCIRGEGVDSNSKGFKFNEIELIPQKREYAPGEKVKLRINTDRAGSTVVLFLRPANGVYLKPKIIRMKGKSVIEEIAVTKKDMPNFFVEAFTISNGKLYTETKEIIVPPEKRVLNVKVVPSKEIYKPGEKAEVMLKLTDFFGKPFVGSTVMTIYDKSVEYISGGSNVPEIKAFFWKWRRRHQPRTESSFDRHFGNLIASGDIPMQSLGVFGHLVPEEIGDKHYIDDFAFSSGEKSKGRIGKTLSEPRSGIVMLEQCEGESLGKGEASFGSEAASEVVQPVIRKKFADTAFWAASLTTDEDGYAKINLTMPENLTGWKVKAWAMGHGTKVGQAEAEVVTAKNLLLRMQAPRFFIQKDEVVLSANVHNYLKTKKSIKAVLEFQGNCLKPMGNLTQTVTIEAGGEQRVDWRVKVVEEGEAIIRMLALTDEESDAMEMRFPVYVHGMSKTVSYSGAIRPKERNASIVIDVPKERRVNESRLEIRYSPSLAGAMVDALPYLVEYPYGCTEQVLNRFLPTVITQKILKDMGLNLKDIQAKRTNLNAQEIGDDVKRMHEDWKRLTNNKRWDGEKWVNRNPVFDEEIVGDMVKQGLKRLTAMQLSDGGWGWFSGWGEYSYPHTTAVVVHGLQIALKNDVAIVPGVLQRGVKWLKNYQTEQVRKLKNAATKTEPWKQRADNIDAFIYMVLSDADVQSTDMREFLYRDRLHLSVYGQAMYGLALYKQKQTERVSMILRNIEQYLVQDEENQTAYLNLPNGGYWWYWYGSEYEAHAYYLKLLSRTNPKDEKTSRLVKYLLNNRKHATYWNSTRDTALCIEALADYFRASGEDKPDMTIEIYLDGKKYKQVKINAENLFTFDNKLVIFGDAVETGRHKVEIKKTGIGPVYFNAYLNYFTLEDFITRAGLEVKVNRKYYKLIKVDKMIKAAGSYGQALNQKVEKYERKELANFDTLKSGDLIEIELEIDSKNDYEYMVFEDMKAAGFEPVDIRSGYTSNGLGAYMELRDERVCFFIRALARGKHSVSYRMRAEIPGKFSALPTRASAMYAPELKGNSDEIKLSIED